MTIYTNLFTPPLVHPFGALGVLDLTLKRVQHGAPVMSDVLAATYPDAEFDFDGRRRALPFAGAYAATRPAAQLALVRKPLPLPRR